MPTDWQQHPLTERAPNTITATLKAELAQAYAALHAARASCAAKDTPAAQERIAARLAIIDGLLDMLNDTRAHP